MTDTDSTSEIDGTGTDSTTDTDAGSDDTSSGGSIGRRGLVTGLVGLGILGTATGSARAASTPLEFGGSYTGDPGADWGLRLAPSNARFGILGFSDQPDGRGVVGRATSSTGATIGVIGRSDSSTDEAAGLMGFNDATSGRTYGFKGRSDSTEGRGALGIATADSGNTIGLEGRADSPNGVAVSGTNTATSGVTIGVLGQVNSPGGFGLYTPDNARIEGFLHVVELGAVDPTPLAFVSDGKAVLRLFPESGGAAGNVLAGHSSNRTGTGVVGATVSGGGYDDGTDVWPNRVLADFGTVGGGRNNEASGFGSIVAGGTANVAGSNNYSTVSGGRDNTASGFRATVGGGGGNTANEASTVIAGGEFNEASGIWATIGGGLGQRVAGDWATVAGGEDNSAPAFWATIGGGQANDGDGQWSTVGGGRYNAAQAKYATVGGGGPGGVSATGNVVYDDYGTIGGGGDNRAGSDDGVQTSAQYATVAGGLDNVASGPLSTVPGGGGNVAGGDFAFAAGRRAKATDPGSFVWADRQGFDFTSNGENTWSARSTGGARFVTGIDGSGNPTAGAVLAAGSGTWSALSARAAKTDVRPVDPEAVLDGVRDLEVNTWQYTAESGVEHMGPMAEDFHDAFGLGPDAEHITTIDADGVLFAAVQGLAGKLDEAERERDEKDRRIDELETEIDDLEAENEQLRDRLDAFEERLSAVETGGDDRE